LKLVQSSTQNHTIDLTRDESDDALSGNKRRELINVNHNNFHEVVAVVAADSDSEGEGDQSSLKSVEDVV